MARLTNGSSDLLAAAFNFHSGGGWCAVSAWLWRDNISDTGCVFEFGSTSGAGFDVFSNQFATNQDLIRTFTASGTWADSYPAPSAGAWHHYLWSMASGNATTPNPAFNLVWIDGVAQTLTAQFRAADGGFYGSDEFTFMGRLTSGVPSKWLAGRICEVALWTTGWNSRGAMPADQQAAALSAGVPAPLVQDEALVGYWPLLGDPSPEPDYTAGQATFVLTGSSVVNHPAVRSLLLGVA